MSSSYLIVKIIDKTIIQHYQVEMMANNQIPGILPFDVRYKDGEVFFYYNITSKLVLDHYIKRKPRVSSFAGLIASISGTLSRCQNYFLSDDNFLLDENYIFINPSTLETYMVYVPVKIKGETVERLRDFVTYLIMNFYSEGESCYDRMLQKILGYLKEENFSAADFSSFLRNLTTEKNVRNDLNEQTDVGPQPGNKKINTEFTEKENEKVQPKVSKKFNKQYIVIGVLQVLGIVGLLSIGYYLKPLRGDTLITYAGIGIIIAALDMLITIRLMNKKYSKVEKQKRKVPGGNHTSIPNKQVNEQLEISNITNTYSNSENTLPKGIGDTVLLGQSTQGYPCLRCVKDGIVEEISITKPEFVIGRLKDQVDYAAENIAVGKVHAVILQKDDKYFIKDLNSRNGTFVNNVRIESNKEFNIKNNDRITLANRDYIFTVA